MLIGLWIRDVVLIEALDLSIGPGLTALTGETGAGKSIILDALGLATGARADAGLVRRGANQAAVSAIFAPGPEHPVWDILEEKGLSYAKDEDLVLRRTVAADGRSRAFVNDQATSVGVLKDLGGLLVEVHGQHETVGLLDARSHRRVAQRSADLGREGCRYLLGRALQGLEQAEASAQAAGKHLQELDHLRFEPMAARGDASLRLARDRALRQRMG